MTVTLLTKKDIGLLGEIYVKKKIMQHHESRAFQSKHVTVMSSSKTVFETEVLSSSFHDVTMQRAR